MLFNIDADNGSRLAFWVVSDNPEAVPSVYAGNRTLGYHEIVANVKRPDLVDHGLHANGMAGFSIDETLVPGLGKLADLEIIDAQTGLAIYARDASGTKIKKRLLIWNFLDERGVQYIDSLFEDFALAYTDIQDIPAETLHALLSGTLSNSLVAVGKTHWLRVRPVVEHHNYSRYALLCDPYVGFLKDILREKHKLRHLKPGETPERFTALVQDIDLASDRSIGAFLRNLMDDDRLRLRSPMTRAFARSPGEDCRRQDVAFALQTLSQFDLVCTDRTIGLFSALLRKGAQPGEQIGLFQRFTEQNSDLIGRLRRLGPVTDFLNEDVALYDFVSEAIAAARQTVSAEGDANGN